MRIEKIESIKVVYKRAVGPYGISNFITMENFKKWCSTKGLLDEASIIYGIIHDDPSVTSPEKCRYDACLAVTDYYFLSDDGDDIEINEGIIVGGNYMVFEIDHTTEALENAWGTIFSDLSDVDAKFDISRPIIERYEAQMVKDHKCEICVPIY